MRLLKRKVLERLKSLESWLGLSYTIDSWGDQEHIPSEYSHLKNLEKRIKRLEKKTLTDKELKGRYDD